MDASISAEDLRIACTSRRRGEEYCAKRIFENDVEMLEHGMVMYDALYAWCRSRP
jgi:hypothetical protein